MKIGHVIAKIAELGVVAGSIAGVWYVGKKSVENEKELRERYRCNYSITAQWMSLKSDNKSVLKYFHDHDIKSIGIYGMGNLGELLYKELKGTDVEVKYFSDKNAKELYYGVDDLPIYSIEQLNECEKVDAIIVTPVFAFETIKKDLGFVDVKVISLQDVVFES